MLPTHGFLISKKGLGPVVVSFIPSSSDAAERFNINVGYILLSIAGVDTSTYTVQQVNEALARVPHHLQLTSFTFCNPHVYKEKLRANKYERNKVSRAVRAAAHVEVRRETTNAIRLSALQNCGVYASKQTGPLPAVVVSDVTPLAAARFGIHIGCVLTSIGDQSAAAMSKHELDETLCNIPHGLLPTLRFCSMEEYVAAEKERNRRAPIPHFLPIPQQWDYDNPCEHCGYVYLRSERKASRGQCCMKGRALTDPAFPKLQPLPYHLEYMGTQRTAHITGSCSFYNGALQLGKL